MCRTRVYNERGKNEDRIGIHDMWNKMGKKHGGENAQLTQKGQQTLDFFSWLKVFHVEE